VSSCATLESEIGEIQLKSGNTVSTGALASWGGFWGIDCLFLTQKGRPVAMLKSLEREHTRLQRTLVPNPKKCFQNA